MFGIGLDFTLSLANSKIEKMHNKACSQEDRVKLVRVNGSVNRRLRKKKSCNRM